MTVNGHCHGPSLGVWLTKRVSGYDWGSVDRDEGKKALRESVGVF